VVAETGEGGGVPDSRFAAFCAFAGGLVGEAEWCIGVEPSPLESFTLACRSGGLSRGRARRLLHEALIEVHRASDVPARVLRFAASDDADALAVCFRDRERFAGILVYARRAGAAAFAEREVGLLRDVLSELQERFAATFGDEAGPGLAARRRMPALCILRPDLSVETGSVEALALALERDGRRRLPARIEARIEAAVADWGDDPAANAPKMALRDDGNSVLRIFPLAADDGPRIAVMWEPPRREASVLRSAERYALTRREIEVLQLLADGFSSAAIAARLSIAESTVNEHVARMMQKTDSANRVELVATTLINREL
jgi:DNA-binding NarL/FixJ family response regulator